VLLLWAGAASAQAPEPEPGAMAVPAQLVAVDETVLSVEIAGRIDRLPFRDGERFEAGDELIGIDCTIQEARLDKARAASHAADTASAVHRRLRDLNSASTLETQLAIAEAAQARAELNLAQAVVSKCSVPAPFGGRVVARHARAHAYVQAGQPVLEILDDRTLEATFILPSTWVTRIAPGQPVTLHIDETGATYPATISRLGARIDPVSHSLSAVATIDGTPEGLLAGMTGRIRIPE
jgi:RND family efflux transporter MFP subunit